MGKAALVGCLLLLMAPGSALADPPVAPNGIALFPDYLSWKVVAPSYRTDRDVIRVITGNETARSAMREGRIPLPDGAVLAKITWKAEKNALHPEALVPGAFQAVEFMVKDAARWQATGGWGYARFLGNELKPYGKDASFANECFDCHKPAADNDYLFTRIVKVP